MRWLNIVIMLAVLAVVTMAQPPNTLWTTTFGTINTDLGYAMAKTGDGGYITAGYEINWSSGLCLAHLAKVSASGTLLWMQTYGDSSLPNYCYDVIETSDGGYAFCGNDDSSLWVVNTDSLGNVIRSRKYRENNLQYSGGSIAETPDQGFVVVGSAYSTSTHYDVYVLRLLNNGDILWSTQVGGSYIDGANDVRVTEEGNFIVVGSTYYSLNNHFIYLLKFNDDGDTLWTHTIGNGSSNGNCLDLASDGGYIIGGIDSWDACLLKTDRDGNAVWMRTYGGPEGDCCNSVKQTTDSGYVFTGYTYSFGRFNQFYLVKTDALGNEEWSMTAGGSFGYDLVLTEDGGYATFGYTNPPYGSSDFRIARFANPVTSAPFSKNSSTLPTGCALSCFPNPFNLVTTINYQLPAACPVVLTVYDISGRVVANLVNGQQQEAGNHTTAFNGSNLASGIYLVSLQAGKSSTVQKIVLVK